MRDAPPNRPSRLLPGFLLLCTLLVYLPTLGGDFVFDDHRFIPRNPALTDLGNIPAFFTDPSTMTATNGESGWNDIYRPLRTVSFALDLRCFGLSPFAFRLENLLWHLLAVVLAFLLARRLLGHTGTALMAAGVFALHPLQVESVAWISSRGDLMAATFLLGAALVFFRRNLSARAIGAGLLLFVLALFSKESAIAFVAVLPVHDYCFRVPIRRRRIGVYLALLLIGLLFLALRFSLTTAQLPFASYTIASTGSGVGILGLETFLPGRILPYTGDILTPASIGSVAGLLVFIACVFLTVVALVRGRKSPEIAFGFLFAALCLLPVSGIVPIKAPAAARYAYLPLLGVGLILGAMLRGRGRRAQALGVVVLVALCALTLHEGPTWRTDRELWERTVARARASLGRAGEVALSNLANLRAQRGDMKGARDAFEASLRARPRGSTYAQLGMVRLQLGDPQGAYKAIRQALALDPKSAPVQFRCGMVLGALGRADEEIRAYRRAIELSPEFVQAAVLETGSIAIRANVGIALLEMGRAGDALPVLRAVADADPRSFILRFSLARAQAALGRKGEARRNAELAARLATNPDQTAWVQDLLRRLR